MRSLTHRWSCIHAFVFLTLSYFAVAAPASRNITSTPGILVAEEPAKCPVSCSSNRDGAPRRPVCGSDARTYTSACHLRRAQCQQSTLTLKHRGKCKGGAEDRPCWADRKIHLKKRPSPAVPMFTPTCRSDGRYTPIQCFDAYCWCVDPRTGKPVPNTSVEGSKPNCNKNNGRKKEGGRGSLLLVPNRERHRSAPGNRGPVRVMLDRRNKPKPCGRLDRTTFNKNMLDTFKMEFRRVTDVNKSEGSVDHQLSSMSDSELQRRILDWKFSSLDQNRDQQLEKHEYRGLRRLVRRIIMPRRCAKTFTRTCDADQNEIISREEWNDCLGLDFNISLRLFMLLNSSFEMFPGGSPHPKSNTSSSPPPPHHQSTTTTSYNFKKTVLTPALIPTSHGTSSFEDDLSQQVSRGPSASEDDTNEENGCIADRQTAMEEMQNASLYIPECTPDGRYLKKQCYQSTGYCFCVDEDTGKVLPGTSVKDGDPRCDSIIPPPRPMKGCLEPKKQIFLRDLMSFLRKKMPITLLSTNSSESLHEDEEVRVPLVSPESVANYHFRSFDRNKDKVLVRTEWKAFRTMMETQVSLRHCGRKLPRHCDVNRDRKISMTEWLLCLGVSGPQADQATGPSATTANPKRTGKNPIEELLKPEN